MESERFQTMYCRGWRLTEGRKEGVGGREITGWGVVTRAAAFSNIFGRYTVYCSEHAFVKFMLQG